MMGTPVALEKPEADAMISQYQETTRIRQWSLEAASVMHNHTHIVIGVPGDPDPDSIVKTLKAWATRAVKKVRPLPSNGAFWTGGGSKRKLPDETALRDGVIYVVLKQPNPLAVTYAPRWKSVIDEYQKSQGNQKDSPGP
jgi:REP element-mobilizing transposase RayT